MNVYFYCYPHGPADKAGYEHQIIALAEGLDSMGVNFKGNVNYWLKSNHEEDYLIKKHHTDDLNEFDVVVFSSTIWNYKSQELLPDDLFSSNRKYKLVFIDSSDGFKTPGFDERFKDVDFVLKSHFCSKYDYPKKFIPWQFGLTNRIIEYSSNSLIPFELRHKVILSNFRVGHQLRDITEDILEKHLYQIYPKNIETDVFENEGGNDLDYLFWKQTGRRHYPSYYKRLGKSMISNAVGGTIQKQITNNNDILSRIIRKVDSKMNFFKYDRVFQFDSWRFWESLVSSCCTLHVDFEKYSMKLPVMPINGLHYIGIDIANPSKALDILRDEDQLQQISENGRKWARENYSPSAVAKRFLELMTE
jgi:hypothetical protein